MSNSAPSSTGQADAAGKQAAGSWPQSLAGIVRKVFGITSWFNFSEDPSTHSQLSGQERAAAPPPVTDRADTTLNNPKEPPDSSVTRIDRVESPSNVSDEAIGSGISERCVVITTVPHVIPLIRLDVRRLATLTLVDI